MPSQGLLSVSAPLGWRLDGSTAGYGGAGEETVILKDFLTKHRADILELLTTRFPVYSESALADP